MTDVQLTFYCAVADRDTLADALRVATRAPLHLREEQVLGRDFGDARAGERVRGALRRAVIDLIVETDMVALLVAAVADARRDHPVRWRSVPVSAQGRIA